MNHDTEVSKEPLSSTTLTPIARRTMACLAVLALAALIQPPGFACTIVVKATPETVLVGNNEDYYDPRTKIWFVPGADDEHGRVIWGYDRHASPSQGGMNEHGLFIDINAIGFTGWQDDPELPNAEDDIVDYILSNFVTLKEVIRYFQTHDTYLDYVKYVVAESNGDSAIFEWLDDKLHVIRRAGDDQISTNYLSPREHTEIRYQISEQILKSQKTPTVDLIRKVLSATAYDVYFGQTLYSTICDLKNKKFYLYHFHYFEEVVEFDLAHELAKGARAYAIPSLFSVRTQNEYWFDEVSSKLGARDLMRIIDDEGIQEGMRQAVEMKEKERTYPEYDFPEWALRSMGKNYSAKDRSEEAIAIFELTAQLYPESGQAHADLGEALMANGDRSGSLRSFQKALELSPGDEALLEIVKDLQSDQKH
jgi:tetratricopeptide (TPR) repeat protein